MTVAPMLAHAEPEELDAGPHKSGRGPERLCVVTRTVKPVEALIRFVVGPDGTVLADLKHKLPGRGLWVTADKATLADAVARKAFARGFKRDVRVAPDLADQTEALMVRAALDALAIAGKSGLVAAGFAKTEASITRETVVGLLHASDAGTDGVSKLRSALRRQQPDDAPVVVIEAFTSAQLDLALGRSNVVHAALLAGPANDTFLARFARLERFRTGERGEGGPGRERH
jgi:predicted RNA-binding protein YlxR (DUF448 family)